MSHRLEEAREAFKGLSYREQLTLWRELRPVDWTAEAVTWTCIGGILGVFAFFYGPDLLGLMKDTLAAWRAMP